ncbi:cyclic nucleotide-binding domain-containing protein [Fervidobacterium thailandense]|uniref:Crp/Fnr family transcriptional regulator n=1 Tax=Fervidobacterium thailandense TaxID=1008305 RepID=A0A1E3G1J6_9BACT|nr:cyclic nucleotide-binding domain-containing protein [Fervidobacterium thailandense]ODN30127.1 Crp/Fnr family transcriptional regulator [Fervidobacterium thailandense]
MRLEGTIFKAGEVPKRLFKIVSGTVRETRKKTYHDLTNGDFVALVEYLLQIPVEEDVIALEETELVEVNWEDEFLNILDKVYSLREIISQTSVDVENIVLDDFQFEEVNLDEYLDQIEALLTLSAGELPDDKDEAVKLIESLEEDKLITKVNLVKKFVEKFPSEEIGAKMLIETAAKVYIVLGDKYIAKALLKKVLFLFSNSPSYCLEAVKTLESIYREEGNIMWRKYRKIAKVLEARLRGNY